MRRWLFAILARLSLLMWGITLVLWARSYHTRDQLSFGMAGGNGYHLQSILGRVHLLCRLDGKLETGGLHHASDRLSPGAIWNGGLSGYPTRVEWHGGFVWQNYLHYTGPFRLSGKLYTSRRRLIVVPYWFPAIVFAVLPGLWAGGWLRNRRRVLRGRRGLCERCGYDLRASADRCPECGMPVPIRPGNCG